MVKLPSAIGTSISVVVDRNQFVGPVVFQAVSQNGEDRKPYLILYNIEFFFLKGPPNSEFALFPFMLMLRLLLT